MLRAPKCSRCRNHGFVVPVKGHAGKCRWKQCHCEKCNLIIERQKIMAKHKMLVNQAAEDGQEAVLDAQAPPPAANPGPGLRPPALLPRPGPETSRFPVRPLRGQSPGPSAFWPSLDNHGQGQVGLPSRRPPQLGSEAAGKLCPGHPEPLRPASSLLFVDFGHPLSINLASMVGAEYLEREPSKLYLGYSTMYSYHQFPLGYQDASPAMQKGFRHAPCASYQGGVLAPEPVGDLHPNYYTPPPPLPPQQQPLILPPGFLSGLHLLPPPPPPPPSPTFSLNIQSEGTDNQASEVPSEPHPPSAQEQSD
ncbi:doublesex- and mab-3-related transcription factor B1 isoform X1 [Heterocephalus glaber]|uniref:Doublesex- and mab-3-related transcription factor B1 isoform X1 n=1 Tax=Heterocephalus glaber TaxID=10181 RepID=A0AAX6QG30_HETGA|nr:doublesex- and mab-3-related transcription factor B1 isoform X1 [Heterocephalus glaber]